MSAAGPNLTGPSRGGLQGQPGGPGRTPAGPRRLRAIPLLLAVSGWAVLGIAAVAGPGGPRSVAVFAFALLCPGVALVRLLPLRDPLERTVLSVALGMSLAALAAETAAIGHVLQPLPVLIVLAAVCSAAAITELARGGRTP